MTEARRGSRVHGAVAWGLAGLTLTLCAAGLVFILMPLDLPTSEAYGGRSPVADAPAAPDPGGAPHGTG